MRAKILSASAGSGKTYRLAYKYVHDVIKYYPTKPYLYRAILAVTFTNKATEEMKSRILKEINSLITAPENSSYMSKLQDDLALPQAEIITRAKSIQSNILHDYSRFTILTIDKFFQRILRAFIKELGIDLNYNIELDTSTILSISTDSLIEDITSKEELQRWIMEFAEESIEEGQRWDIRQKILSLGEELFKESNKQTILNSTPKSELLSIIRDAEARVDQIIKRCKEIGTEALQAIQTSGLKAEDLAGKSTGIYLIFSKMAKGEIVNPKEKMRKLLYSTDNWAASGVKKDTKTMVAQLATSLQPLFAEYCNAIDSNSKLLSTLPFVKATFRSYALLQDIYQKVREQCDKDGVMLLPETKYILSRFVAGNDAPFIYEKIGNRFERYMIDEFQDTSGKEWENFVPLLQNALSQSEDNSILIVGDVKQSIYRWRGGDWRILNQGVEQALGTENTEVEIMSDNFRSLKQVVEFNNMAVGRVVEEDNNALNGELRNAYEEQKLSKATLSQFTDTLKTAYLGHNQTPKRNNEQEGYVMVEKFNKDEELPLVECIESAIQRGYAYKDIMVLCRDKKDGEKAANILLKYKQRNNAFNIMTQDSLIVGKSDINQFIIATLRLSQNSKDSISRAIVNNYVGRPYSAQLEEDDLAFLSHISQLTPEEAFEHIVTHYKLNEQNDEIAYLQALHEQIIAFNSTKVADIQLFLKMWDEKGADKSLSVEKSDNTIELTTIHKSKGLEKKIVIIPYCSWGLNPRPRNFVWATPEPNGDALAQVGRFPVNYKNDMENTLFSEDYFREKVYSHVDGINLLYVALTRAQEELYAFIPSNAYENTAGHLLWNAVADRVETDPETNRQIAQYGSPINNNEKLESKPTNVSNVLINSYPTTLRKMELSLPQQRYYEEECAGLSPRNMGIMMHSILSEASDLTQIQERINEAYKSGKIDQAQASEMQQTINREFKRPEVKEWFGEWDMVRNENDIIGSHTTGTQRPDRVMIKGNRAVVVDYKFGLKAHPSHRRQVGGYMQLLAKMGYRNIEGYVWYLSTGEIVRVEPQLSID